MARAFRGLDAGNAGEGGPGSASGARHLREVTALTKILLEKRVLTLEELHAVLIVEAEELMRMLEARWPGVRAVDDGLSYDAEKVKAATWWRNWKP